MSKNNFLNKPNINMLWEVLADEDIFKNQQSENKNTILKIFSENISVFYNSEIKNPKTTLIEMNKKYILMILNFIKNNYSNTKINKLTISNEPAPLIETSNIELITNEQFKQNKQTKFEEDLNMREQEFKNMFTKQVPDTPTFSDNTSDKPITEMERAIKEMVEQRNYDMEQINKIHNASNNDNFLKSIETSNKPQIIAEKKELEQIFSRTKHIALDNNIDQNQKHVTWGINENIKLSFEENNNHTNDTETKDIFSKLKPIQNNENEKQINLRIINLEKSVENINEQLQLITKNISQILQKII